MGEAGTVDVDSAGTTINFQGTYATPPLVFAFITTTNESDATVVRVSNVTTTEFNIALDEVGNGTHGNETVTYIVLQEGQWLLPDGSLLEVGTFTTTEHSDSFETIGLNSAFTDAPAVFSQVQTNESTIDLLKTRHDNATKSEIKITLEGADNANMAGSENETIAYFAIERGSGAWGHINFEAGSTSDSVSHNTSEVSLNTITPEHFIAAMANFDGADNASTRGEGIVDGKLNLFVEEDTTVDAEIAHTSEVVDYLAFSGTGLLLATPQAGLADTGGFSYDPGTLFDHLAVGDTATDTFTYTVTDLTGQESTATVTITIHGENDAPTSSDNAFTIDEDNTYNFKIADFAFTDIDDGDSLKAIQIDSLPAVGNGVLLLNGNPVADGDFITAAQISQLSFTPDSNDFGVAYASFNFSVQDQQNALSSSHSLTINVNEVNDQAIFSGNLDGVDVENGADISGSLIASDINDGLSDPNFTILGGSPNGTATIDANGNWNFTPNANFSGLTSFTVQITDDNGNNETVLVIITVTPAPIINPSDTERPTTAPQVNDQAAIILASVNQEILRGNAFLFLSDGGGLHFNERFLSEDSLNLISDYFNSSTFEDTEVAANDDEIEVKTLNIYDVSALPTEEQEFIKNLILQEINEATEEKEEKEDSDDLSFLSDEMALQEIVNQSTEEIPFSQFDLDKRVNLEDTLMNEFDCLTINHLKHS
jgi:VCBS repeat-containing protein